MCMTPSLNLGKLYIKGFMVNDTERAIILRGAARKKNILDGKTILDSWTLSPLLFIVVEKLPSHKMEPGVLSLMVFQRGRVAKSTHICKCS